MLIVASYVIAFVILTGLIDILFLPVGLLLTSALKNAPRSAPYGLGLLDVLMIATAILLANWIIQYIGSHPTLLMFLIPGIALVNNDLKRIQVAKTRCSNVALSMKASGEYTDPLAEVALERAHLVGGILGWLTGAALFLRGASFV